MSMATVGRVLLVLTRHLPQQMLTTSTSILQMLARRITTFVGKVSPSAVWYTSITYLLISNRIEAKRNITQSRHTEKPLEVFQIANLT